jgi:hypothetical protein
MNFVRVSRIALVTLAIAISGGAAHAQNTVVTSLRSRLANMSKYLPASAELMPAEKYEYKPTPSHLTFAQHMVHMADFNEAMCAVIGGVAAPAHSTKVDVHSSKAEIVEYLRGSFAYCSGIFGTLTDANLGDTITLFGQSGTKATASLVLAMDWSDHYAVTATYLRLNGLLPPTAKK